MQEWVMDLLELLLKFFGLLLKPFSWPLKYLIKFETQQDKRKLDLLLKRYEKIYVPLRLLLAETHITTVSSERYPHFSTRIAHAFNLLKDKRWGIRIALTRAWKAIFDCGKSRGAEVEYGVFPFKRIKSIINENGQWADSELIRLCQWADRAQYESSEELPEEQLKLVDHIYSNYEKLHRKLIPK